MALDDVRDPGQTQTQGPQPDATCNPDVPTTLILSPEYTIMHDTPLRRAPALTPRLLDVDQCTLPLAVCEMLQAGDGQELVVVVAQEVTQPSKASFSPKSSPMRGLSRKCRDTTRLPGCW